MFTAAPDCTKIGIDTQIVRHTCAPLFTAAETGLSSKLSSTGQRHSRSLYHFFFESRRSVYPKPRISDPAEGAEAAVDRNHDAVYEVGGWAAQPNQGADEFLGLAKTAGAGVLDYRSASLREAPILIQHVSAGCNLVMPTLQRHVMSLCRTATRRRNDPHDGPQEHREGTPTCRIHGHKRLSFRILLALDGGVEI